MISAATNRRRSPRGSARAARREVVPRARRLVPEQRLDRARTHALPPARDLRRRSASVQPKRQILERQIEAAAPVRRDVAQDVGQLQRHAQVDGA